MPLGPDEAATAEVVGIASAARSFSAHALVNILRFCKVNQRCGVDDGERTSALVYSKHL